MDANSEQRLDDAVQGCDQGETYACPGCIEVAILKAYNDARFAGFAEAIEMAAKVALAEMEVLNTDYRHEIVDRIRALAPAKLEEPK